MVAEEIFLTSYEMDTKYLALIPPHTRLKPLNNYFQFMKNNLQTEFGNIDIYLFDQLLKGRFNDCKKVIDVGCGSGRNIAYFLTRFFDQNEFIFAVPTCAVRKAFFCRNAVKLGVNLILMKAILIDRVFVSFLEMRFCLPTRW